MNRLARLIHGLEEANLENSALGLDGDDLIADEFKDAVDNGFEALEDLLIRERHVAFFDACFWELCLDAHIDSPLLAVVPEVCFYSVLEIHDAFGVYFSSGP